MRILTINIIILHKNVTFCGSGYWREGGGGGAHFFTKWAPRSPQRHFRVPKPRSWLALLETFLGYVLYFFGVFLDYFRGGLRSSISFSIFAQLLLLWWSRFRSLLWKCGHIYFCNPFYAKSSFLRVQDPHFGIIFGHFFRGPSCDSLFHVFGRFWDRRGSGLGAPGSPFSAPKKDVSKCHARAARRSRSSRRRGVPLQ